MLRISYWSSDVCSSDLGFPTGGQFHAVAALACATQGAVDLCPFPVVVVGTKLWEAISNEASNFVRDGLLNHIFPIFFDCFPVEAEIQAIGRASGGERGW